MSDLNREPAEPDLQLDAELKRLGGQLRARGSIRKTVCSRLEVEAPAADAEQPLDAACESRPVLSQDISSSEHSGEMSMLQKLSLGSVAASVLLVGVLAVSNFTLANPSLADVVENVREVASYQAKIRIESQLEDGKPATEQESVIYWAPGAFRMDSSVKMPGNPLRSKIVTIRFQDKPGIELNVPNKTFRQIPAAAGARSPLMALEQLANYRGDAAEDLGVKRIEDTECYGFSIPLNEVDENVLEGTMVVWVDRKTDLPIEIHMGVFPGVNMITSDFQWNKSFGESVFDAAVPNDFTEGKSRTNPVSDDEKAEHIVTALRIYAKISGGSYPPVRVIYGDVIAAQLRKLAGIEGPPYSTEALSGESFQQINETSQGFAHMTVLMRDAAEAEYFGKSVTPSDDDEVLFRWKGADGKMQLIYGDLRTAVE